MVCSLDSTGSPEGLPSTSSCVDVTVSLPSSPGLATTTVPAGNVGSGVTFVSKGTACVTLVITDWSSSRGPYSTIIGVAGFVSVRVTTDDSPSATVKSASWVASPFSPCWTTLVTPGARSVLARHSV